MSRYNLKVCLIEYENHQEVLRSLSHFFLDSNWQVTLISHKICLDNLVDLKENKNIIFLELKDHIVIDQKAYNLAIYVTPSNQKRINNFPIAKDNAYLMIHNHNYWLNPYNNIYFLRCFDASWFHHFLRFIKYWKPGLNKHNQKYLKSFKGILSPSYLIYTNSLYRKYLDGFLDISYYRTEHKEKSIGKVLNIVIPGTVNKEKDYVAVTKELKSFSRVQSIAINLYFLGKNNFLTADFVKKFSTNSFNIYTFDKSIPQSTYDSILKNADLGILPVKKRKDYKGIMEIKGKSNLSGGFNDMVRFNIPLILPNHYSFPKCFNKNVFLYSHTDQIKEIIIKFILNKDNLRSESFHQLNSDVLSIFKKNSIMLKSLIRFEKGMY